MISNNLSFLSIIILQQREVFFMIMDILVAGLLALVSFRSGMEY
nr:unnamed protein product [uncultured bacterium]